jgi:hypothetical protein
MLDRAKIALAMGSFLALFGFLAFRASWQVRPNGIMNLLNARPRSAD